MISNARLSLAVLLSLSGQAFAQSQTGNPVPVTVENFTRAESDVYFAKLVKESGGLSKYHHAREPASIDNQTVIRMNRDTLYSTAVFDLDAGPVTITLPNSGKRFMSMQVVNEDQYTVEVVYGAGSYKLTRQKVGTRYAATFLRTLVDPANPKDVEQVQALQDGVKIRQKDVGKFEIPNWEPDSHKKVREALLVLAATLPDYKRAFGTKQSVDPIRFILGAASGWGGNPDKDATYVSIIPPKNDGEGVYKLTVKDVPVNGFWSVSVYNGQGYFEKNPYNAYSINNITGQKNPDGSITIQFGGCDGKVPNCLPIMKGWNTAARLYRPRDEILKGTWKFPEMKPAS
ncbi:DUF1254 domain-containing protein [Tardiphaga sp. 841_E9_N1_2]|uniref:DUF1254 domain-containing protein n=1 Tax=Tardiphaga sp. 841_E9_N1_2 TaxID=3240762 RepID=UPI003F268F3A